MAPRSPCFRSGFRADLVDVGASRLSENTSRRTGLDAYRRGVAGTQPDFAVSHKAVDHRSRKRKAARKRLQARHPEYAPFHSRAPYRLHFFGLCRGIRIFRRHGAPFPLFSASCEDPEPYRQGQGQVFGAHSCRFVRPHLAAGPCKYRHGHGASSCRRDPAAVVFLRRKLADLQHDAHGVGA